METQRPFSPTGEEAQSTQPTMDQAYVTDNTATATSTTESSEAAETSQEPQVTQRADRRIQELANRARDAEERAKRLEEMTARLIGIQQPVPDPSKQFKSFNEELGYPTDPKDYARWNQVQAAQAATIAARSEAQQERQNRETGELLRAYPDIQTDVAAMGAIAALQGDAMQKGGYLSYREAADAYFGRQQERRVRQAAQADAADTQSKNEAYVEGTRGASSSRQPEAAPDPSKMNLEEMERYMKDHDEWNQF